MSAKKKPAAVPAAKKKSAEKESAGVTQSVADLKAAVEALGKDEAKKIIDLL